MRIFLFALSSLALLPACGTDTAVDASTTPDAPALPDAPLDVPAVDASDLPVDAPVDVSVDAGAPVCPAVAGGYTLAGPPASSCPSGGPNQYGFELTLDTATCGLSFDGFEDALNILYLTGTTTIGADGSFGATSMMINGTEVTCSAVYSAEPPASFAFDCGDCDFTIRYGE